MLHSLIVSLGSNCGDRHAAVAEAICWLSGRLSDFKASEIYETPPYGHAGSDYMNAVVSGNCECSPEDFEAECKIYELKCGRNGEARMRNLVPIDIDVVISDGNILREADFSRGFFKIGYRQIL